MKKSQNYYFQSNYQVKAVTSASNAVTCIGSMPQTLCLEKEIKAWNLQENHQKEKVPMVLANLANTFS